MSKHKQLHRGDLVRLVMADFKRTYDRRPFGLLVNKRGLTETKYFEPGIIGVVVNSGYGDIDVCLEKGVYRFLIQYVEKVD